jgi:hypothetical protein
MRQIIDDSVIILRQIPYFLKSNILSPPVDRILTAFSLKRNWFRLISETKPEHRDLSMEIYKDFKRF